MSLVSPICGRDGYVDMIEMHGRGRGIHGFNVIWGPVDAHSHRGDILFSLLSHPGPRCDPCLVQSLDNSDRDELSKILCNDR